MTALSLLSGTRSDSPSDVCKALESPNVPNLILSIFLVFGILISYIPQHVRIYRRRSSEGLSPWFVLLGTTSGTCAIANILVLPMSRTQIQCCAVNSATSCLSGLLGIAQIGTQWSCFFVIMLLFIIFVPRYIPNPGWHPGDSRHPNEIDGTQADVDRQIRDDKAPKQAVFVVAACVAHFFVILLASILVLARYPSLTASWANFLGLLCAALASVQYLPQIWTTWRLKHIGSLSIPTMCIQTPGAFVFAASLFARLGPSGWSAWAVYVVTGALQGCLLVMACIFEHRERMQRRALLERYPWPHDALEDSSNGDISGNDDEHAALLGHERPSASRPRTLNPNDNPVTKILANVSPESTEPSTSVPQGRPKSWWQTWPRAG